MSLIKTPDEIEKLKRGGALLSSVLRSVADACRDGVSTVDLDQISRDGMAKAGGTPSFLNYKIHPSDPSYPSSLCISINDEVVHGPATPERHLKNGDVVGLDIGMWYEGLATDMAMTVIIGGAPSKEAAALVRDTRESLVRGLATIKAGALISDIGAAVEDYLKPKGYGIVKDLVGHGVGHAVHEDPQIPNYREPRAPKIVMSEGMVLAIEPMITLGGWRVKLKDDGWTIATSDGSLAAHWEVTVAVTAGGYELITPWPDL